MLEKIDISKHLMEFIACTLDEYTYVLDFESEYGMYTEFINHPNDSGNS